nr:hypoxanthine phosphoribosyltransferase [Anaerolineae bacterium]
MKALPPYSAILNYVLIDADRLQKRVGELGAQLSSDYAEDVDLVLLGILKGCVPFMTDLTRKLTIPHMVDYMDVTSYGTGARETSGRVRILMDIKVAIENRDVLIIEDIVDSGNTLAQVIRLLKARQPKSIRVCSLLDKPERREVDVAIDYVGFQIPNAFVFGYGLDIDEYYRNLPFIGVVKDGFAMGD